jgi:ATP-dependent HslUV protease ATP-binding subunit HslU
MKSLTPREIVSELDRYIIGQQDAKKAVAIALRNRYRRKAVDEDLRDEIVPKNILMVGSTGVGKTEIARRLAKLADAPFLKVEATKFTEVGYVGRDVESIIRDITEQAIAITRVRLRKEVEVKAEANAEERVLDSLVGDDASEATRQKFRVMLRQGELDDREIELQLKDSASPLGGMMDMPGMPGSSMGMINIGDMLGGALGGGRTKTKKLNVCEAHKVLVEEESDKLIDEDKINQQALESVENDGIVFLDEIDKIAVKSDGARGGEVSREGVQRDLLPLIEGTVVSTKYGQVKTDHILFIASGAFHVAQPSDLLPELQGRLPIRVQLESLSEQDMLRILDEPESSLTKQYAAMMKTEGVALTFTEDGLKEIAKVATEVNNNVENIGARRLHTIMEKLLEEVSFTAGDNCADEVVIDQAFVEGQLGELSRENDLSRFIL